MRELWAYREVAAFLAIRDLKLVYKQAFFGLAWVLVQPLATAAVLTLILGRFTDIASDGLPYLVFVYSGLVIWLYHASAVEQAVASLTANRSLVTQVYFPRLLAPIAALLPGLVGIAISLVALGAILAASGVGPSMAILTLPVWIGAAALVSLGAGSLLGALNVRYRDVGIAVPFIVQLWLFASPVFYPSALLEGEWRALASVNPLVGVIDGFRWAAVGGPAPPPADVVSLLSGLILVGGGLLYFRRVERHMADLI